ncbi:MAG: DUF4956 domain-containing protein [Bacteroidetes bacterium]|nr:MAG: DUF4956 domain-containing protein [Bacteroidota bacterium]PTM14362.1 MAG: DUF4956 domain-containing protein [Bacteroidota bacterium]
MDFLQELQERYIQEFSNNVPLAEFLFNIFIASLLASLVRLFYIHYGNAVSNRRRFGNNFLPLALGTLLVIMIVKSSIALSLGLVGALSIVRFRAAIKDPEELVYLFMTIGLGLACGANQPLLAVIAIVVILGVLWISKRLTGESQQHTSGRLFLNITTDTNDLDQVTAILVAHLPYVELKRLDTLETGLDMAFVARADSPQQINQLQQALRQLSPGTRLSLLEQPELIV